MPKQILALENYIDHTILKPDATIEDVKNTLNQAKKHKFVAVCINPVYVKLAKDYLKDTNTKIVTVIDFPLGAGTQEAKGFETEQAIKDGADEVDLVIDIGAIKSKNDAKAQKDIELVVNKAQGRVVKVIIETDLLTKEEIVECCTIVANAGADFVKTSTGFVKNGVGATVENVKLMKETVKSFGLKVKASGGIKTKDQALAMIEAGVDRIGTSSGLEIIND